MSAPFAEAGIAAGAAHGSQFFTALRQADDNLHTVTELRAALIESRTEVAELQAEVQQLMRDREWELNA